MYYYLNLAEQRCKIGRVKALFKEVKDVFYYYMTRQVKDYIFKILFSKIRGILEYIVLVLQVKSKPHIHC